MSSPEALAAAELQYIALGWPVFPLAPRGKLPLIGRKDGGQGLYDATTDEAIVRERRERWPNANIGIRTGIAFDVVDIDSAEGIENLRRAQGDEPGVGGPMVVTKKGCHLYFAVSGLSNRAGVVEGVDVRGQGGYVVAPPSRHPDGHDYAWDEDGGPTVPLEPIPRWLLQVIEPPWPTQLPRPAPAAPKADAYARRALESELGKLLMAGEGTRNHTLNAAAFSLGQLVGAGVITAPVVVEQLLHAALTIGLTELESERTILSGLAKGIEQPRRVTA